MKRQESNELTIRGIKSGMSVLAGVLLVLVVCVTAFGQVERRVVPAEEIAIRTGLESDRSVIQLTCGLMMPIEPAEMYAAENTKKQAENTRIRLKFYASARNNQTMRAARACETDEGTTVRQYLLSEKGKLTYVDDYSRDYYGGLHLTKYDCTDLIMGHYGTREGKGIVFEDLDKKDAKGKVVFLTCTSTNPDRRKIIF